MDGGTAHGRQRTDSTHILAKIRSLNRTLLVAQAMVYVLAEIAPDWVRAHAPAEWVERYGQRQEHERLPKAEEERKEYACSAWGPMDGCCLMLSRLLLPRTG
ncbi:MAG TPA: hypothetical protein VKR06_31465 [Ktedonosporobacter sp.]|nr:hypothetical protein [Ktedonosporobacter sp.]